MHYDLWHHSPLGKKFSWLPRPATLGQPDTSVTGQTSHHFNALCVANCSSIRLGVLDAISQPEKVFQLSSWSAAESQLNRRSGASSQQGNVWMPMEHEAKQNWSWIDWMRFLFYRYRPPFVAAPRGRAGPLQ